MTALYPWLTPHYDKITAAFSQGHGHHALLFKTDSGVGAERLIHAVALFLLCRSEGGKPCGTCHHCRLFLAGSHPDFHLLAPIENKDIGIDQVREVNEKVGQHAQQNGNKVVYVQGAERLTENAANALLKTLEEPRPNTYFLLRADLSAPLMATIYSRCQTWLINVPPEAQALAWLQTQCHEKIDEIDTALRVSHGRPLFAQKMLEQGLLEKRREFLRHFWLFYSRRSPLELLPYFDKDIVIQQLDWIAAFLSDALKGKLNIRQGWVSQDLARGIEQFDQQQTALGLLKANQIVHQMRCDLTQINGVNQELILLDGLTRLITEVFDNK
ncbi:DNA polymerase III subunit delta' [Pasteurellaceae bacterium LIM206]|nr:DNA polymerase III subunit delta' [Pasteurellaceae bacterium LIM206]